MGLRKWISERFKTKKQERLEEAGFKSEEEWKEYQRERIKEEAKEKPKVTEEEENEYEKKYKLEKYKKKFEEKAMEKAAKRAAEKEAMEMYGLVKPKPKKKPQWQRQAKRYYKPITKRFRKPAKRKPIVVWPKPRKRTYNDISGLRPQRQIGKLRTPKITSGLKKRKLKDIITFK